MPFRTWSLHLVLFLATIGTVALQGVGFVGRTALSLDFWPLFQDGLVFAVLLLAFLGTHEFGHYFAALRHGVKVTLPYFIPVPFLLIGTLGAVIRILEPVHDSRKLFDIGIAGPIAGFLVSLLLLLVGFVTLPGPESIHAFAGHEDVKAVVDATGAWPDAPVPSPDGETLVLGGTLLFDFLASFVADVPPMWELYHYPWLFAGWLGLFFTALNLMPVGQLDGGHILYGLLGWRRHRLVSRITYAGILLLGGVGAVPFLHELLRDWDGPYATLSWGVWAVGAFALLARAYRQDWRWVWPAWVAAMAGAFALVYGVVGFDPAGGYLMWAAWAVFIQFGGGLEHPPALIETPLSRGRRILGWASMGVFVLCISPSPISILF